LDAPDSEYDKELKREIEERTLHRMAKIQNVVEMWKGCQHLHDTLTESHTEDTRMTAIGYILDAEEIVTTSWTNFQLPGAAALKLSEKSR
jgi:hypothetical protein